MIDSHCHLDQEPLYSNILDIVSRCKKVGIVKLLTISTTNKSFENILKIVEIDPIIYGTFGIHPHETKNELVNKQLILNNVKKHKKIIAIGETGLDFYYNNSEHEKQIESFKIHIEASIESSLPLIVHSRSAEDETFNILNSYKNDCPKIIMHCFTGSETFANKLLNLNAYFSASGIITFKNSLNLQNTFKQIPIDNIIIETDSPFLAPVPMRGKKNEPSYLIYTLKKLSDLKKISENQMAEITSTNFKKIFNQNGN